MSLEQEKSALQGDIESLTIHGLSRVASAKNKCARIIWLVLCITAAVAFGIVAVKSIIKYYQYNSHTHITFRQKNVLALPAITFCHRYAEFLNMSNYNDFPVAQHLPKNCSFHGRKLFSSKMNQKVFEIACRVFIVNFKSKTSAMNLDNPQYLQFPKGFEITPFIHPCVTLNRNSTLIQHEEGEKNGLHMIMYNEGYNLKHRVSTDEPLTDKQNGIYAVIHDPKQIVPFDNRIVIPPGYHTQISVTKNVVKRLPHPYPSKCTNDWSNSDSIYPGKNTQKMCKNSCGLKKVYEMCQGILPGMRVFMQASEYPAQGHLKNLTFLKCLLKSAPQINYQQCDCPELCYDETYTTVTTHSPWPPRWEVASLLKLIDTMEGKANETLSANDIRERLMKVSIYYNEFKEYVAEEHPLYDILTIISDLGGQMGLFMGASLLSLAEIIALVGHGFKRCLHKCAESIGMSSKPIRQCSSS